MGSRLSMEAMAGEALPVDGPSEDAGALLARDGRDITCTTCGWNGLRLDAVMEGNLRFILPGERGTFLIASVPRGERDEAVYALIMAEPVQRGTQATQRAKGAECFYYGPEFMVGPDSLTREEAVRRAFDDALQFTMRAVGAKMSDGDSGGEQRVLDRPRRDGGPRSTTAVAP